MTYQDEFATGDSLIHLENSESLKDFNGRVLYQTEELSRVEPAAIERDDWLPRKVLAIDGSNINHRVRNGFPGADASLLQVSIVVIDVKKLRDYDKTEIPRPSLFREIEKPTTVDTVLPGGNVVRRDVVDESPVEFFREAVFDSFDTSVTEGHETLLQTLESIRGSDGPTRKGCPVKECANGFEAGYGKYVCGCDKNKTLFSTDALRFDERFNDTGKNGEVHGEVRSVLEALILVNVLRFFERNNIEYLGDVAFILDGPLSISGQPAKLSQDIKKEIERINRECEKKIHNSLVLFGVEKSGNFINHFEDLDFDSNDGPRGYYEAPALLIPNEEYIKNNIELRVNNYGKQSHYGRKMFYKTAIGAHSVITPAMLNDRASHYSIADVRDFPRLGHVLNVMDELSTFLYQDGFIPLVRAHAQASIPLKRGTDIIQALFE